MSTMYNELYANIIDAIDNAIDAIDIDNTIGAIDCDRCNWQNQPIQYGFTECFCDLLTPYLNEQNEA